MLRIGLGRRGKVQRFMEGAWRRIYCYTLFDLYCDHLMGYGLSENKQILRNMYRLGRKAAPQGYQLNDQGLVECKVGVIRPQPFLI